jgi:hypothetical protein
MLLCYIGGYWHLSSAQNINGNNMVKQLTKRQAPPVETKSKAVTIAAREAGTVANRFSAVEIEAERIHAEQSGSKLVRALMTGGKMHAVISDGKSTLEVHDGVVALSVAQTEEP